jgi:hypothetical protein
MAGSPGGGISFSAQGGLAQLQVTCSPSQVRLSTSLCWNIRCFARRIAAGRNAKATVAALQHICRFGAGCTSVKLCLSCNDDGRPHVDLALRLDVLAMCAVFAFLGAILLGAF